MAHSLSRRRITLEQQLEQAEAAERARPINQRLIRDAKLTVAMWNVRVARAEMTRGGLRERSGDAGFRFAPSGLLADQ